MKNNDGLMPIGEAAEFLGVSIQTLRRWDKNGKLVAYKTAGGQRRYLRSDLERIASSAMYKSAFLWATKKEPPALPPEYYCQTRAVFEARLQRYGQQLESSGSAGDAFSLIVTAAGEIGNNSFDHNLGNWRDSMGVFFGYDVSRGEVVLADRGQGILATLRHVQPSLDQHTEALKVAFTEVVTGRAPEKRGNGLKYVRKVIEKGAASIKFRSGNAMLSMGSGDTRFNIETVEPLVQGTLASLKYNVIKK